MGFSCLFTARHWIKRLFLLGVSVSCLWAETEYGENAGYGATTTDHVVFGQMAGWYNQGSMFTGLGLDCGRENAGSHVTAVGYSALGYNDYNYSTAVGSYAGFDPRGQEITSVGYAANWQAKSHSSGFGHYAGASSDAMYLTSIGYRAGNLCGNGTRSTFVGAECGRGSNGGWQAGLGSNSLQNSTAYVAVGVGGKAGYNNAGERLISLGYKAGQYNTGDNCVFIGEESGGYNGDDNRFELSMRGNVLLSGDFSTGVLRVDGRLSGQVGADSDCSDIWGDSIRCADLTTGEITVKAQWWSDHVFSEDYGLMSVRDLEEYIDQHGHLPNIPSETAILRDGIDVNDMMASQLAKIEELTLYTIDQDKQLRRQQQQIDELKALVHTMQAQLSRSQQVGE